MQKTRILHTLTIALLLSDLILASCGRASPAAPSPIPPPLNSTQVPEETSGSTSPRTLIYCSTPAESLYPYSADVGQSTILQAIYDGPIDNRGFDYQPVILKKLPSLADGDAQLVPIPVAAGDQVVDADGEVLILQAGVRVRPSGCQADDCAIEYDGSSPLQMDQLVARFELLSGLLWSDGQPLTASDSVYSYQLQSSPVTPSGSKYTIERTASYQALDELTTEWRGLPGFLDGTYLVNFFTPAPQHAWGKYSASELLTAEVSSQRPLGWGPYVVQDFDPEEGVTLTRNENYFRRDEGLPAFDQLWIRFVAHDVNAAVAMLRSGECDVLNKIILSSPTDQELELLQELANEGQINATFISGTRFEHLDFGIQTVSYDDGWQVGDRPDFFSDVRVRRAFALCMDRQKMMQAASVSQSIVLDTYLPPQHPLYNPNTAHYDFDPAAGAALLEDAGWMLGEDGVRIYTGDNPRIPSGTRFSVNNYTLAAISQEAEQVMVDSLAQCGIQIMTSYWAGTELFAAGPEGPVFGRQFDLAQFRWLTGASPPCDIWLSENIPGEDTKWQGDNDPGFSNPEYDQACLSALQSLPGQPGHLENHLRAQEVFAEQLPLIMLYFNLNVGATRPDFCGYILDPTENTDTWNIEAFNYGPDC